MVTAAAIVAGMAMASVWRTRPSASQSQSAEPQREEDADAPADAAGDQRGAPSAPDTEQAQRRRGRHHGDHDRHCDAQEHPADGHRQQGHPPIAPGARPAHPRRTARRPKRLATSSTSDWRGWNASAWSTSKISEAFVDPPNAKR